MHTKSGQFFKRVQSTCRLSSTHNLSILAIPAYYIFSVLPHNFALNAATESQLGK
ncbi:hypothetical protein BDU57DRAFT_517908 [Ampelomyces quisqualis]|uniref:Uncharacterized protein n=1 Tax=Ampelomyces quisqualis TaxID=50730 RepID=A0A6A5QKV9_AMPQU|nr:hypothetical protein BDU57DRAFT_517908 [Ampelomyces quisqualis]